ncbi:unnamed protein product, partial [Hymenolepis diminuta]
MALPLPSSNLKSPQSPVAAVSIQDISAMDPQHDLHLPHHHHHHRRHLMPSPLPL